MKVYSITQLKKLIDSLKLSGDKVGLCHGCFDILHTGHIRHFEYAKKKCDHLFVSVTADRYINKDPGRPVFSASERSFIISSLNMISGTIISEYETSIELLTKLQPAVYFKGQEYSLNPDKINKNFLLEKNHAEYLGIEVQFTYEETDSSTSILNRIRNN